MERTDWKSTMTNELETKLTVKNLLGLSQYHNRQ